MNHPFSNKRLGQHFLRNKKIINLICSDYRENCDAIVEIGPGNGALTESLSRIKKNLYLFEKDQRFKEVLGKYTTEERLYIGDALEVDFGKFCFERGIESAWVVGNLPYNVSAPFFIRFIKVPFFKKMTLMFQKEVAHRIFDSSNRKKSRGGLMALAQNYFHITELTRVDRACFSPVPKVEGLVLSFERLENPPIPLEEFSSFELFLRLAFSQRRKQLFNRLLGRYDREALMSVFCLLNLDKKIRAEDLTFEQIKELYAKLEKT